MGISPEQWLAARGKANVKLFEDRSSYISYGPDKGAFFRKLDKLIEHENLLKTVDAVVDLLKGIKRVDVITLDFETYYDKDYSLRKRDITLESYIRDPRFEVIGVGLKVNDGDTEWASGTHEQIKEYLHTFNWKNSVLLAHNTMFDGAIISWLFDVHPRLYADTLCIARAIYGSQNSLSLDALVKKHNIGVKGKEVLNAVGKRRGDFTEEELDKYGDYCVNDVELTYELFKKLSRKFPRQELHIIDASLRMFTEPMLDLNLGKLEQHLEDIRDKKDLMLAESGVTKAELMSNPKFAEQLEKLGVPPPMKTSPANGKETYAFAKTDEGFNNLLEHDDPRVQTLVAARLGNKSTLEETRTQRFIDIAKRGLLPVPVKYYAAHTGRWGGDDKINMQNLPSRGEYGKVLKGSILAPKGHTLIDCDSSQIEARVLAWLAEQDDLLQAFVSGEDVYVKMAAVIYGIPEEKVTKQQRFVGKTTILGCGYGMGAARFKDQLQSFGFDIDLAEAKRIVQIYRKENRDIYALWGKAQDMLADMTKDSATPFGRGGVIIPTSTTSARAAIRLPSGLNVLYSDLQWIQEEDRMQYSFMKGRKRVGIYGGKVIENVCQALARCIIGEQILDVAKKYKVVLTVHDSIICCVPDDELTQAREYVEACMRKSPQWAEGIPLDCESGYGKSYGECSDG